MNQTIQLTLTAKIGPETFTTITDLQEPSHIIRGVSSLMSQLVSQLEAYELAHETKPEQAIEPAPDNNPKPTN